MDIISVIMPIYNVEEYIRQGIESVLNQTYKKLEIILVDDGSKDTSGNICDEYAKKDNRIKVIHKENGGVSSARNAGINIATGKYIMFIDPDDFFENNACELLYNEIEDKDADYVMANYVYTNHKGEKWGKTMFSVNNNFEVSMNDYKKALFVMNSVIWNKIFKRDFIEKHKLRFIEEILAEDAVFSMYCYAYAEKGYYINDVVYNYRQSRQSKSLSTKCTKDYFSKMNVAYKLILDVLETTNNLGFYRFFCARIMPYFLCKIIDTDALKSDKELLDVLKMFEWYFEGRDKYGIVIINNDLNEIIDYLNNKNYDIALKKMKEIKVYRNNINDIEKEKMYIVTDELYTRMLEN